jgi:ketosteroid isomerase-like protein
MERAEILKAVAAAYAARVSEDAAALAELWTDSTTFEIEGEKSLIDAFPATGPMGMSDATDIFLALVKMSDARQEVIAVDGNRAVVLNRATLSFGGGDPLTTTMCDVWEFDEAGKVRSLHEFLDTALLAHEMAGLK